MKIVDVIGAAGLLLAVSLFGSAESRQESRPVRQDAPAAIGTYDSQQVLIAYYKSPQFKEKMRLLHEAHAEAKLKGDTAKMKELERQGEALQERAHDQYEGKAPLTEVIDALRPSFPEVAKAAGVGAIVADFVWRDPAFKTVDLTERLVQRLAPPPR
jgi:hypothetical protein